MAQFFMLPIEQWFDNSGAPLAGGLISFFAAGTTTPQATYTDSTGGTQASNPVVLDSAGRAQIWLSATSYKFVVKTSASVTLLTVDNYAPLNVNTTLSQLVSTGTITMQQGTAATSGANQSSNALLIEGTYWDGAVSQTDTWQVEDVLGSGTNPTSTLTVTHSGSSGTASISLPATTINNATLSGGGSLAGTFTGNPTLSGNLTLSGNNTLSGTNLLTGTNTTGPDLPATVDSALSPFHAPFNAYRQTTESGQPDHYPAVEIVNYQKSGGTNSGGKTKPGGLQISAYHNATGESFGEYIESYKGGTGDNVGIEVFANYGGNATDSGGECAEAGRFQVDGTQNTVFTATLDTATNNGSTFTLTYSTSTNELYARGVDRVCIRTDGGTYTTGTISSFSGTGTITAVGSGTAWATQFGSGAHSDLYLAVDGDVVGGMKFVVPITSITDDTHLVLTYAVNAVNQSWPSNQTGTYTIYRGSIVSDVSTFGQITVTNGYTGWAAAQTIEMPVGYTAHMEGIRVLVNPAIPWGGSFPLACIHCVNLNTSTKRRGWGMYFDSAFGLSRGLVFNNTWGADPAGNDSGGTGIRFNTNPATILASLDASTATNIFDNLNTGDVLSYDPSVRKFGIGTTGTSVSNVQFDPTTGKISRYGTLSTQGQGVAPILGVTLQKSETAADTTLLSFTPPAAAGQYRVNFSLSLSAANTATLGWTVTYKNSNGTAMTPTNMSLFQVGVAAPALTFTTSAAADYYGSAVIDIDNSQTAIVVKLTFSGTSFTGKASASIDREQ